MVIGYNRIIEMECKENMKKNITVIVILIALLSAITFVNYNAISMPAHASGEVYARVKYNNTYLYKSAAINENTENKWCLLPETFFVKVLNNINDQFYKAEFLSIVGYVKKMDVNLVNEIPKNPYPSKTTFATKSNTSCYLRSSPKISGAISNVVATLPASTNNLEFLGKIIGEEAIDLQGTIWYLTKYNDTYGYIYSYYTNTFIANQINSEQVTLKISLDNSTLNPLTNPESAFLIFLILIPVIVVLTLLYKPKKQRKPLHTVSTAHKEKIDVSKENNYFNDPEL